VSDAFAAERDYESMPDDRIVRRCRRGDDDAWRELVRRFSRYVYAITTQCYRLSQDDAEDVFQEVWARTYTNLERLRSDDAIRPWIGQLTRRLCVDTLRGGKRETLADEVPEPREVDEEMARLDQALDVHRALATLPEHCHEVVDRFFVRDESYQVIGEALGLPPGTIASRISRCLAKLKEQLAGRGPEPATSGGA
jgi:RNA polymerase sigma-70 factor (ECF subfamily)